MVPEAATKLDSYRDHDLREVHVWSTATLRRMRDVASVSRPISADARRPTFDESATMLGDASLAVVALHGALSGTRRYLDTHADSTTPMDTQDLEDLRARVRDARDAVAHLDEKMTRSGDTSVQLTAHEGLVVTAPRGRAGEEFEVARISWVEMEAAARACLRWLADVRSGEAEGR